MSAQTKVYFIFFCMFAYTDLFVLAGWTPLHHAALLSPPTLISYLMTHDCSPFDVTRRNLTALDIVTAHSLLPGREDVALLLEEAMRGEGWSGGRMEDRRRLLEERMKRRQTQRNVRNDVGSVLGVNPVWWGVADSDSSSIESESDDESEDHSDAFYASDRTARSFSMLTLVSRPHQWIILLCWCSHHFRFLRFSSPLLLIFNHHCGIRNQPIPYTYWQDLPV